MWVRYIFVCVFVWVKIFWVGPTFLCGSFFFWVGQLLFTRWDYFTILQLIVWAFLSWVSSQQIFTKPCLTPLVFLSGLLEICKIDCIQWHFYERVTKFYLWAANWPYSQRRYEYSQTSCSSQTPQALFENSTHLWKLFVWKKLSERMLYHALNRVFRFLCSYTGISNIFCKMNYDGQSRQVFS